MPPAMKKATPSLGEKLSYRIDNLMSLNPAFKLVGLFGLTSILVLIGGTAYWFIRRGEDGQDFVHGLWAAWTFIADAGTQGGEENFATRAAAMFITIGGMMIFALLLGLVSETLGGLMDNLKEGHSRVIESGHTLILGWNEKIFSTIEQLVEANSNQRRAVVVVLSDLPKADMEKELQDKIEDFRSTVVVCRSGNTTQNVDLVKVNATEARSIIVLGDDADPEESDVRAVKTVLALSRGMDIAGHVVVEIMDPANAEMVKMVGAGKVEVVAARDVIGRLMVQTARQNGLAHTYGGLLGFEGSEFYLKEWKQLAGKRFDECWPLFPDAVVCGVKPDPNGPNKVAPGEPPVVINPPASYVVAPGDELLFLAEDDDSFKPKAPPAGWQPTKPPAFTPPAPRKENLLWLGWRRDLGSMIRELDNYVAADSTLTLVSVLGKEEANERLKAEGVDVLKNLKLRYRQGNLASRKDLEALRVQDFDSIMILAADTLELDPDEVDSRTLMSLLLIRDIQKKNDVKGKPVLSEIRDPRTKALAEIAEASDYVVSNEIVSLLMATVSENREMNTIWADLFDADGNEIYLKHAHLYAAPNERVTFYDLMARARARGEVCIGYRLVSEADDADHGVALNPAKKDEAIPLSEHDRVIVLSQNGD